MKWIFEKLDVELCIVIALIAIAVLGVVSLLFVDSCESNRSCVEWEAEPTSDECSRWMMYPQKIGDVTIMQQRCASYRSCKKCVAWRLNEAITEKQLPPHGACK